ncbi:hypothetical protein C8A00DRAFT_36809 [Chaetomidium leptoderma]|uniref:Uncharacterized protein n=1 Tax=Chaetomidium leptoderma TaxID=669021 RepID=A0AAN6VFM5_9PEZI|nr:hypothetical protein C8A00DRAFT_36809 [Chaetomidium leptoderma]
MANLPPRPTFTNLSDGAPSYNSRRRSSNPSGLMSPRNSSNPRHYHPYDRQPSTPALGSPIPPWRRDPLRQNYQSGLPKLHGSGQFTNSFASRTGNTTPRPAANTNAGLRRQQTVYEGGPVMYAVNHASGTVSPGSTSSSSTDPSSTYDVTPPSSVSSLGAAATPIVDLPSPVSRLTPSGPSCPRRPPLPVASASHAGPSAAQKVAEHTPSPAAAPESPSPLSPPRARKFCMNDRNLVHNLSAAADQPAQPPPVVGRDPPTPTSHPGLDLATPTTTPTSCGAGAETLVSHHHHDHQLPPLRPCLTTTTTATTTATATAIEERNTTLTITLGTSTRTLPLPTPSLLTNFTAWTTTWNATTQTYHINLTALLPGATACPPEELEAHLDALEALLCVMLRRNPEDEEVNVDVLWRLGGLREGLGLEGRWVAWMRGCMGGFVRGLKGVGGWLEGGGPDEGGEGDMMEKAMNVCLLYGWAEEFRAVAGRLAYVCRVGEDGELVKPDGRRVEQSVCGRRVVDCILAAREQVFQEAFVTAQKSLCSWTIRIGRRPCDNITCNTNRIAALNVFLLWSGLFPRTKLNVSLHEIVSALQYITATDAELMAIAIENGREDDQVEERLAWAAHIRQTYRGTCTKCSEKTATSTLFPLEDLLCDLTFEMQTQLQECVGYPRD